VNLRIAHFLSVAPVATHNTLKTQVAPARFRYHASQGQRNVVLTTTSWAAKRV